MVASKKRLDFQAYCGGILIGFACTLMFSMFAEGFNKYGELEISGTCTVNATRIEENGPRQMIFIRYRFISEEYNFLKENGVICETDCQNALSLNPIGNIQECVYYPDTILLSTSGACDSQKCPQLDEGRVFKSKLLLGIGIAFTVICVIASIPFIVMECKDVE